MVMANKSYADGVNMMWKLLMMTGLTMIVNLMMMTKVVTVMKLVK